METGALSLLGLALCFILFVVVLQVFPPGPLAILMLVLVAGLLGYGMYLDWHNPWDPALNATQEREILVERSVESIFESCLLAPRLFPFLKRLEGDMEKGLLSGTALTMDDQSAIVISLVRIGPENTRLEGCQPYTGQAVSP